MAEAGKAKRGSLEDLINQALDSQEPLKKPEAAPIKPQGLLERIILSRWTAPAYAAAMGTLNYLTPQLQPPDPADDLIMSGLLAGLGYITAKLMRQDWLMRKAGSVRSKKKPLPFKALGIFSEHPEIIAGGMAAYVTADLVSPMFVSMIPSDIFRHLEVIPTALQLSAYAASMSFTLAYSAVSLSLGRILHPETAKAMFKASAAVINAWRGRYKEAASNISQLLETQKSYRKAVELQSLVGDMRMLDGQIGCLDTYINALSTDKTSYLGRSDWIFALTQFIPLIRNIVGKAKRPQWAEAKDIAYIVGGVHAFAEGPNKDSSLKAADALFRMAVQSFREGLIGHVARAAFLRKTRRQASADLEVKISAEIIMKGNPELVEVTEESRNEVFFSGNLALKRNKDPEPLRGELSLLERLRGELGQSIIYPLPIYKIGDFYYSLSERGPETLLELMRQRKARFEDFAQAITLMAKIQKFAMKLYDNGELNFDDAILRVDITKPETLYFSGRRRRAIEQIERFNGVKLPESYKDSIIKGMAFVDAELAPISKVLTMYSDRGPKNWLKQLFGQIQALDFEPKSLKLLPPQMDLVNLLEFAEYLTPQHRQRLIDLYIREFEKEHCIKIDRQEFNRKYEFAGLQWHYERLIYNPEEAAKAKAPERQEAKKREQIYHLAKAREHLDKIIEREYVKKDDLPAALRAGEELKRPVFADITEWQRLEEAVNSGSEKALFKEPLPPSPAKLAVALSAALAILGLSTLGLVAVRNNLIPFVNAPVFQQPDRILLAVSGERETIKPHRGIQEHSVLGFDYYVINTERGTLQFLTQADNLINSDLSLFNDKVAFIRDTKLALYDLRKKELKVVEDNRFENPIISPNGLWVASNLRAEYIEKNMSQLWVIRPYDAKAQQITDFPNAFLSPWSRWSPDSTYLQFFSNNELDNKGRSPDDFKVWINTYNVSTDEVKKGPQVANMQKYLAAWSPKGLLAYTTDDRKRIYVADPQFNNPREVYKSENRDMHGYDTESLRDIAFAGPDHLIIASTLFNKKEVGVMFTLSTLNLKSLQLTTLDGGFIDHISRDGRKVLYSCGDPFDICELDISTGQTRNITNTPNLRETNAIYSTNSKRIYVVAVPPLDCRKGGCIPSLFSIDLRTGESKVLKQAQNVNVKYSLVSP